MAVRTRIDPIGRDLTVVFPEDLSPAARSSTLAAFAREALADGEEQNRRALGRVPAHETYVDGRHDAPLESVRPDGRIVFEFDLLDDLFAWVGEQLVKHSPALTGRYRQSHVFLADGVQVDPGAEVPPAEEYVFLNVQPYARKIERGLSAQASDGVYEAVATLAARRFGNMARIRFSYRALATGQRGWAAARQTRLGRIDRRKFARDIRQPAIVITLR